MQLDFQLSNHATLIWFAFVVVVAVVFAAFLFGFL